MSAELIQKSYSIDKEIQKRFIAVARKIRAEVKAYKILGQKKKFLDYYDNITCRFYDHSITFVVFLDVIMFYI